MGRMISDVCDNPDKIAGAPSPRQWNMEPRNKSDHYSQELDTLEAVEGARKMRSSNAQMTSI